MALTKCEIQASCLLLAIAILGTAACRGAEPVELVLQRDRVVSNGPVPVPLPVYAIDATGKTLDLELRISVDHPELVAVVANSVRCLGTGDAKVSVAALNRVRSFRLLCRPVVSFGPPERPGLLVLGQTPEPINPVALDGNGARVAELAFRAVSSDTSVAAVQGATLVARSVGVARVRIDFGGIATDFDLEVVELIARDSLRLVAGEWRSWRLPPGRYRAEFSVATDDVARTALAWRSPENRCAYAESRAVIHCSFEASGIIALTASRTATAVVRVVRRR